MAYSAPNRHNTNPNASSSSLKINLTLLIDKKNKRVLYAEAGKDFVDFLFGVLKLPVGFVLGLLNRSGLVPKGSSIGRIYQSVKDLDPNPQIKNSHLKLHDATAIENPFPKQVVKGFGSSQLQQRFRLLQQAHRATQMQGLVQPPPPPQRGQVDGHAKGATVRYVVMNDLTVKPMSSSVQLLKSLQVRDIDSVEEKTVEIDSETGLKLVKASMESTTVLTDVFFTHIVAIAEPEVVEVDSKENITLISKKRKENPGKPRN